MKTEEKARAYDEALERARKQRDDYQKGFDKTDKNSQLASILRAAISAIDMAFPELAESEDERHRKWILEYLYDGLRKSDEQFKDHFKSAIAYLEKQKEQKPNIEICPHSVKSKSYKENGFPFEGLKVKGPKGPSSDPGDPGRRGRMGGVPKEISKEAEAFQAQFPAPYDKDDIITAYETAKIKAMEDLPKWKEVKNCGKGECFVGAAFEATGRRYPILFCYGYGISIEQLFEKLPKEDK